MPQSESLDRHLPLPAATEDKGHGEERLKRVPLCAAGWGDVSLAARHSDGEIENSTVSAGRPGPLSVTVIPVALTRIEMFGAIPDSLGQDLAPSPTTRYSTPRSSNRTCSLRRRRGCCRRALWR